MARLPSDWPFFIKIDGEAEVSQLYGPCACQQDILKLNVSVDDALEEGRKGNNLQLYLMNLSG